MQWLLEKVSGGQFYCRAGWKITRNDQYCKKPGLFRQVLKLKKKKELCEGISVFLVTEAE